jgi:hypothetical protein
LNTLLAPLANLAWTASNIPAYVAFRHALADPEREQRQIVRRYVQRNEQTVFGRDHRFAKIRSVEDFRRHVPIRDYDDHSPYVDRIAAGEPRVLTADRVDRLVPSSGSTRAAKLIPYTAEFQREFNRAIAPWITDLFYHDPDLMDGCAYWSITPVARPPCAEQRRSAIPVEFDDDTEYLGGARRRLVDAVMAVPGELRHCQDIETFRYLTMRLLLMRRHLRIISVWHPSFLELLIDAAAMQWDRLLDDIARADPSRAGELRRVGPRAESAWWPDLKLISAWASANAAGPARSLQHRFPDVSFQPKGLLATEGAVTFPFENRWPVAIRSHFFEFLDDAGRPWLASELRDDHEYSVVLTTAGGLWRYRLGDRVRVTGRIGRTPSLDFRGRSDHVVDRFGEKLNDAFVTAILRRLFDGASARPSFAMLAPGEGIAAAAAAPAPAHYTLFVETRGPLPPNLAASLDDALKQNPHYAYCRSLGQLDQPRIFRVAANAYSTYVNTCAARGNRRIGNLKPTGLSGDAGWEARFSEHHA